MPRLSEESFGSGDQSWIGAPHGMYDTLTVTIDPADFTAATHYPDGYLPSGTPLNVADESSVGPWTGAAGEKLAFLYTDQRVVGAKKFGAPAYAHGVIKVANLPGAAFTVPTSATAFVFREGVS